jgi:uncharacterized membrane protein required for colicin V production
MKNKNTFDNFNIELNNKQVRILLIIIIVLVTVLLFRKIFNSTLEKIIVFSILFLLLLIISRNLIITFIGSFLIFLLVNLMVQYRNTIENFEDLNDKSNEKKSDEKKINEPNFDMNIFNSPEFLKSADGIQSLLKQVNGGIPLTENDIKETPKLGIDTTKYADDNKSTPLKQAQKEAYELIDSVNALKDTITTLAPVLKEGKKLMNIFENLKI